MVMLFILDKVDDLVSEILKKEGGSLKYWKTGIPFALRSALSLTKHLK